MLLIIYVFLSASKDNDKNIILLLTNVRANLQKNEHLVPQIPMQILKNDKQNIAVILCD